jgi:hypothetical protein
MVRNQERVCGRSPSQAWSTAPSDGELCRRIAVATACVSALARFVSAGVGNGKGEARVIRFLNMNDSWQVPWHDKALPDMRSCDAYLPTRYGP